MNLKVGQKVLVRGRHAGVIRQLGRGEDDLSSDGTGSWLGIELAKPSTSLAAAPVNFNCPPNTGIFVRSTSLQEFTAEDEAAGHIQNMWRRWLATKRFRRTMHAATWNVLENNQEQLNLKRAEKVKSAEATLALLARQHSSSAVIIDEKVPEVVEEEYNGPRLSWPLTLEGVLKMLESFKGEKTLHHTYVAEVLTASRKLMTALPTLQEITVEDGGKITIVGDIHGQLSDLYSIFTINGIPSEKNKYLFNGDFVDRGDYGTEVVMSILCLKLVDPDSVFLNRGNHECRNQNSWMGFEDEVWSKYDGTPFDDPSRASRIFNLFQSFFDSLPLCSVVQGKIFVAHGGLSGRDGVTLTHLKGISRKREPPLHQTGFEDQVFEDLLWSDPRNIKGRQPSERGAGVEFGQDVTNSFCATNRVALIVRSHECVPEGFEVLHGGRLITLFSASRYCGTQTNKGAFMSLGTDLQPEIQQFYAHPMNETDFGVPEKQRQDEQEKKLESDNLRMIAERICDHKASLFWYFTQHDQEKNGNVPRLVWAEALRSVLRLDIPFLNYQKALVDAECDNTINYAKFLAQYRIENSMVDSSGWQEGVIATICKKLYKAMGAGNTEEAFRLFDADENGYIEYDEFMNALKKLDTGLSDQQIYELMRTADANDDSRIDFKEFSQRFEVVFSNVNHHDKMDTEASSPSVGKDLSSPPPAPYHSKDCHRLTRKYSDHEKILSATPADDVDGETMAVLVEIGRTIFCGGDSLMEVFTQFDTNNDGVLQPEEFYSALDSLGFDLTDELKQNLMKAVDRDGGNTICYKEFVAAFSIRDTTEARAIEKGETTWQHSVLQQMSNVFYQHRIHLRSAFRMFDNDHNGTITKDEFRSGINTFNALLDSPLTLDQIEALLNHLDKNRDGVLNYNEFFDGFEVVDIRPAE